MLGRCRPDSGGFGGFWDGLNQSRAGSTKFGPRSRFDQSWVGFGEMWVASTQIEVSTKWPVFGQMWGVCGLQSKRA